jgi:hypothetical protein
MSSLSSFLQSPLAGVTKASANVLQMSSANPEILVLATDTAGSGVDSAVLRLRNVRQANDAGPNIYLEGTNNASAVKTLGRIQAAFIDVTSTSEDSKLQFSILSAGATIAMAMRADAAPSVAPTTAAAFTLGTAALPWGNLFLGNAGGTRSISLSCDGATINDMLATDGTAFAVYIGSTQVAVFANPSGSTKRIQADFSNATVTSRLMFQTNTTNGTTFISTLTDGTGASSGYVAYAGSDALNTNHLTITASTTAITLNSSKTGTGTTQELEIQMDGTRAFQVGTSGDVYCGKTGLATGGTTGHLFIPAVAGVMTGVPAGAAAGFVPIYFDTTNNKIGVYDAAWIHTAALS